MGSRSPIFCSTGRAVGREGAAEVEPREPRQPVPVLDVQRLVEAELLAQSLPQPRVVRRSGCRPVLDLGRLARSQVDHDERDEGDADEEGNGEESRRSA